MSRRGRCGLPSVRGGRVPHTSGGGVHTSFFHRLRLGLPPPRASIIFHPSGEERRLLKTQARITVKARPSVPAPENPWQRRRARLASDQLSQR